MGGRRLTFRVDEPGTELHGSWLTLAHDPVAGIVMDAPPQVAFRALVEAGWRWYRERDITAERVSEFRKCQFRIYGDLDAQTRIMEKLRVAGCELGEAVWTERSEAQRADSLSWVEVRYAIDDLVLRTVAKIAFNYLARVTQERVPGFVRRQEFDALRAFVRHGTKPEWPVVEIQQKKLLLGDTREYRITNGHVLCASWPEPRKPPIGKVSLFNEVTYAVRFSAAVPGIWWDLDSGHHFDIRRRTVSKLASVNTLVLGR